MGWLCFLDGRCRGELPLDGASVSSLYAIKLKTSPGSDMRVSIYSPKYQQERVFPKPSLRNEDHWLPESWEKDIYICSK